MLCFQGEEKGCVGNEWFKWVEISLFKLSLRSNFKTLCQSTLAWPDPYFSKLDVGKLQSELLPENVHLKIFEVYCRKLLLRILALLQFKRSLYLFI